MDKTIESYIAEIAVSLDCDEEEKRDIIDEMRDHLYLLKNEYIEQGFSEEEATRKALESFGEQKQLRDGLQESLFPFYKIFKIGTWTLFGLYSFIILFKLLFQRIIIRLTDYYINGDTFNRYVIAPMDSKSFFDFLKYNTNVIPFKNTMTYINGADRFNLDVIVNNTLGNLLIFLPLGMFIPLLFKKYKGMSKIMATSIVISFSIEILQIALKIGQFDVDDVILNTFGAMIGFLLLKFINGAISLSKGSLFRRAI